MIFPFMYNFSKLFKLIPDDFLKFTFTHFAPQVRLFSVEKGKCDVSVAIEKIICI